MKCVYIRVLLAGDSLALNEMFMYCFCTILFKAMIVIPTGEGKDRPGLSQIPVANVYVYVRVYVCMLTEIC